MIDEDPERFYRIIRDLLVEKKFVNSSYVVMIKNDGLKDREIWKLPYFPDRIIHHCIVNVCEEIWLKGFIRDTYSSLPGRGVHDGVRRIRKALRDVNATRYCLKLDVKKFYQSVDHDSLKACIRRKIKDQDVLWLIDLIVDSAPGVPIGNYSSQYFANVFLSDFDHWVKEQLRVKYYFRYCDDLVILGQDKAELHRLRVSISDRLAMMRLDLKRNWQVFPVDARGIDFLGYRFFHGYTLVRKSIVQRFKKKLKKSETRSIAAYNGWFVWADTYNLRSKYGGIYRK